MVGEKSCHPRRNAGLQTGDIQGTALLPVLSKNDMVSWSTGSLNVMFGAMFMPTSVAPTEGKSL